VVLPQAATLRGIVAVVAEFVPITSSSSTSGSPGTKEPLFQRHGWSTLPFPKQRISHPPRFVAGFPVLDIRQFEDRGN